MASGSQRVTTYSSNTLVPKLNNASLSNFTDSQNLIYTYYGGSNSIGDKPTSVDAFGVMSFKTAAGWYGQLLMSSNQATGLYWRTAISLSGGWRKLLDSSNYTDYTVTKTGGGASGTWGISITGNAATATKASQDGSGNTITSKYVTVDTAQTITGTKSFGASGAGCQINGAGSNGGINSIRIGDDVWLGDCNQGGIMGMKSTGASGGIWIYNSSGTNVGRFVLGSTAEIRCDTIINFLTIGGGCQHARLGRIGLADSYSNINLTNYRFHCVGNARITGQILLDNGFKTGSRVNNSGSGVEIDTDGGIEIFHSSTPFIDFHYQASTADYSVRLICSSASRLSCSGEFSATKIYNAVWNDYAEFRVADSEEPGRLVIPSNDGIAYLSDKRLQPGGRIISDTYGHAVGQSDQAKTPIGLAGRVLAYPYRDKSEYKIGDTVCSAPGGTVDIMTREEIMTYPDRIVGIVNEIPDYEVWEQTFSEQGGGGQTTQKIEVKGRIWIDIK